MATTAGTPSRRDRVTDFADVRRGDAKGRASVISSTSSGDVKEIGARPVTTPVNKRGWPLPRQRFITVATDIVSGGRHRPNVEVYIGARCVQRDCIATNPIEVHLEYLGTGNADIEHIPPPPPVNFAADYFPRNQQEASRRWVSAYAHVSRVAGVNITEMNARIRLRNIITDWENTHRVQGQPLQYDPK